MSDFSNNVASFLSYYEPNRRLLSCQNGSLFYPRQVRTKTKNRRVWNSLPKDLHQEQTLTSFTVRQLNSYYYFKIDDSLTMIMFVLRQATLDVRRACDIRIIVINMFQYHIIMLENLPLCPEHNKTICMEYHPYYRNLYWREKLFAMLSKNDGGFLIFRYSCVGSRGDTSTSNILIG